MNKPVSMADRAYEMLKRDILRCRFRPGSAIVDTYLATEYGMSRTPIREAMNLLRREGLVVVIPRRGTLVKPIDFGELQDTYLMRQLVEPEAAVLASRRASSADLAALEELGEASVSADADSATLNERNRLLHVKIAELSRIPLLAQTVNALHEDIERFLNYRGSQGRPYTATNHGRIVDAIRDGSEEDIRRIVLAGIERARTHMLEGLMANDIGRSEQVS